MTYSADSRRAFGACLLRLAALACAATTFAAAIHADEGDRGRPAYRRQTNPVVHWNAVAAEAYAPTQGLIPLAQTRTFSILHAAIHDALNAIDRRYDSYTPAAGGTRRLSMQPLLLRRVTCSSVSSLTRRRWSRPPTAER
jgi:hypothetical protein